MVLETRAGLEAGVVSSGHAMAAARLDAQRSIAGWAQEQTGGLSYLNYVRDLSQRIDSDWEGIQQDLEVCTAGHALLCSASSSRMPFIAMPCDDAIFAHPAGNTSICSASLCGRRHGQLDGIGPLAVFSHSPEAWQLDGTSMRR